MMNGIKLGLFIIAAGAFVLAGYGIYIINVPLVATVAFVIIEVGLILTVATTILEG